MKTCEVCNDEGYVESVFNDVSVRAKCVCSRKIDNEMDDDSDEVVHFDENSISYKHE